MDERIAELQQALAKLRPYPNEICEIPTPEHGPVRGRSFFPGGSGLFDGEHGVLAKRPLMIVGNDYDKLLSYQSSATKGYEDMAGTWGGIVSLLTRAAVPISDCFFTNAVMGARIEKSNTGQSKALQARNKAFAQRCSDFLRIQVSTIRPRAVVMLGKHQAVILERAFPIIATLGSRHDKNWRQIDASNLQYIESVHDRTIDNVAPFAFCALMHSCMRASNLKQHGRTFRHSDGATYLNDEAEVKLLQLCSAHP